MVAHGHRDQPSVFVCGPISRALTGGEFDAGVKDLLVGVAARLTEDGIEVLSAHRLERWGKLIPERALHVLQRDWALAQAADAMVFVLPADARGELHRTDGTFIELGWALALDKPIVVVTDPNAHGRSYMFDGVLEVVTPDVVLDLHDAEALAGIAGRVRTLVAARGAPPCSSSSRREPRVGFCSTNFGFGPVSKASAIAEAVRVLRPEAELTFAGSDVGLAYAQATGAFDEMIDVDADRDPERAADALSSCDAIVNSLNFALLCAGGSAPPQHFVDSLGWLWPDPPAEVANAVNYFVQDYLFPPERRSTLPPNSRLVPPIVSPACCSPRRSWEAEPGRALIHLGGCRNPLLPADAYVDYLQNMVDGLAIALADRRIEGRVTSATVCGNPDLLARVRVDPSQQVSTGFLSRRAFVSELRRAEVLLTSPGLTSTLEAMSLGVPCAFLLPHNFSQYRIDEAYRDAGLDRAVWPDRLEVPEMRSPDMPEEEGVQLVAERLAERLSDGALRSAHAFVDLLSTPEGRLTHASSPWQPMAWDGSHRVAEAVIQHIEDGAMTREPAGSVPRS